MWGGKIYTTLSAFFFLYLPQKREIKNPTSFQSNNPLTITLLLAHHSMHRSDLFQEWLIPIGSVADKLSLSVHHPRDCLNWRESTGQGLISLLGVHIQWRINMCYSLLPPSTSHRASLRMIPSLKLPIGLTVSSIEVSSIIVQLLHAQSCLLLFSSTGAYPKSIPSGTSYTHISVFKCLPGDPACDTQVFIDLSLCTRLGYKHFFFGTALIVRTWSKCQEIFSFYLPIWTTFQEIS